MNQTLKWKLVAGFVLVFIAGGITGAFVAGSQSGRLANQADRDAIAQRMLRHLRLQLGLTDQQVKKISPIIDKTATELETIRRETGRRVHEAFNEAHRGMAADLTPEQRTKLQEIEARHRQMLHHRHGDQGSTASPEASASP